MGIEQMMRDVDPINVARFRAARYAFMLAVEALPEARRCKAGVVNLDGSCLVCGDDQGERARCTSTRAALHSGREG